MWLRNIFICFICSINITQCFNISTNINSSINNDYVSDTMSEIFYSLVPNCSFTLSYDSMTVASFQHILQHTPFGYQIKMMLPGSKKLIRDFRSVGQQGTQCSVFAIDIQETQLMKWMRGKKFKSDEESLYIFWNRVGNISKILTSRYARSLKFKVVLSTIGDKTIVHRVCFYCNRGKPEIQLIKRITRNNLFFDSTWNFHGKQLRTVFRPSDLLVDGGPNENGTVVLTRGYHKPTFETMARKLNFTYVLTDTCCFGREFNGSWIGIVGDVAYGKADFSLGLGITYQRSKMIDYSFPMTIDFLNFLTSIPRKLVRWDTILWPYDTVMWLCIIASMMLSGAVFELFSHLRVKYVKDKTKATNLLKSMEYMFSTLLEDETLNVAHNPTTQVFMIFWFLFIMVVGTAYKSKLIAFLANPTFEKPPEMFDELVESDYRWGLQYVGGAAYTLLTESDNYMYRKIGQQMDLVSDPYECLNKTMESKYACIIYNGILMNNRDFYDPYGRLLATISPDRCFLLGLAWGFPKEAVYKWSFNQALRMVHEAGLIYQWQKEFNDDSAFQGKRRAKERAKVDPEFYRQVYKDIDDSSGTVPLNKGHMLGCYLLYIFGNIFGLLFFAREMLKHSATQKYREKAKFKVMVLRAVYDAKKKQPDEKEE